MKTVKETHEPYQHLLVSREMFEQFKTVANANGFKIHGQFADNIVRLGISKYLSLQKNLSAATSNHL